MPNGDGQSVDDPFAHARKTRAWDTTTQTRLNFDGGMKSFKSRHAIVVGRVDEPVDPLVITEW